MRPLLWTICALLALISACNAHSIRPRIGRYVNANYLAIIVDPTGAGNFTTIQAAIDAVPSNNNRWILIYIREGEYREQVTIPSDKPFIYLKGAAKRKTIVVWNDNDSIASSATFTSAADHIIAKCITFVNSYNYPVGLSRNPMKPAVAAMVLGDQTLFYRCGFIGFQDTLWDVKGRHYYKQCTIQGFVDFIFGSGQSFFERCTLSVVGGPFPAYRGYITAQGRTSGDGPDGFVFKDCNILGTGKVYLGRPWRDYARVIFYRTTMSDVIYAPGWDSAYHEGYEGRLTFVEKECKGLGSDLSGRVPWTNRFSNWRPLTSIEFVDEGEGWVTRYCTLSLCDAS